MNFLEKYNTDDVFFRGIIIGLLSNKKVTVFSKTVISSGK